MQPKDFISDNFICSSKELIFSWSAPSNIALVKYWGKKENQLPANPSISLTLNECKTVTTLVVKPKENKFEHSFSLLFEGKPNASFHPKIQTFFQRILPYCPYLNSFHLEIHTFNTFPHSSGIASSASSMAALSTCIMSLEKSLNPTISEEYFYKKASFLARLGSGSATRSIKGSVVVWGENKIIENSNDNYGIEATNIHKDFYSYKDTVLIIDKGEKTVSSTVGHNLMHNHIYAQNRFIQAHNNLSELYVAMQNKDTEKFIQIVENEALTLHAMMMTSVPYFILMKPNTLEVINKIWNFRKETQSNVCFTLDAGANVHVLYPENENDKVSYFIDNELKRYCQNNQYINDFVGKGAHQLK